MLALDAAASAFVPCAKISANADSPAARFYFPALAFDFIVGAGAPGSPMANR